MNRLTIGRGMILIAAAAVVIAVGRGVVAEPSIAGELAPAFAGGATLLGLASLIRGSVRWWLIALALAWGVVALGCWDAPTEARQILLERLILPCDGLLSGYHMGEPPLAWEVAWVWGSTDLRWSWHRLPFVTWRGVAWLGLIQVATASTLVVAIPLARRARRFLRPHRLAAATP